MRSDSRVYFRRLAHRLVKLHVLIKNIQSYDRLLVENTLKRMVFVINSPNKASLLLKMNVSNYLIPLLTLKSSQKQHIIQLTLNVLVSLSTAGKMFLPIATDSEFALLINDFLKGKQTEQKLAGIIVCNMFRQLPTDEHVLMSNRETLKLLILVLRLHYMSSVMSALYVLDNISYHGENVKVLLSEFGIGHEFSVMVTLEELFTNDNDDIKLLSMNIILNFLSFVDTDSSVRSAMLHHSLYFEGLVVSQYHSDQDNLKAAMKGSRSSIMRSRTSRKLSLMRQTSAAYRRTSQPEASSADQARSLHIDIPLNYFRTKGEKVAILNHRISLAVEIIWLLCGLNGKAHGSSRQKRGVTIRPEDRYENLADQLNNEKI